MKEIKQILQREITYHKDEIIKHREISEVRGGSKREKQKATKHFHKMHQTIKIANLLGLEACKHCGSLE